MYQIEGKWFERVVRIILVCVVFVFWFPCQISIGCLMHNQDHWLLFIINLNIAIPVPFTAIFSLGISKKVLSQDSDNLHGWTIGLNSLKFCDSKGKNINIYKCTIIWYMTNNWIRLINPFTHKVNLLYQYCWTFVSPNVKPGFK